MKGTGEEKYQGSSPQTQRTSGTPLQLSGHALTCRQAQCACGRRSNYSIIMYMHVHTYHYPMRAYSAPSRVQ